MCKIKGWTFIVMVIILVLSSSIVIYAKNNNFINANITYNDDGSIMVDYINQDIMNTFDPVTESLLYGNNKTKGQDDIWWISSKKLAATDTKNTNYITVDGQLRDGYNFPNGGSIYIKEGRGSSVSVSLSFNYGIGSITVSPKPGKFSSTVTGVSINIPANSNFYLAKGKHFYEAKKYNLIITNGKKEYSGTEYETKLVRSSYATVRSK